MFSSEKVIMLIGCMAYVGFFSMFWLCLVLLKHFNCWQLQNKFSKENCYTGVEQAEN